MTAEALDPLIHVPARLQIMAALATLPDGDQLSFTREGPAASGSQLARRGAGPG